MRSPASPQSRYGLDCLNFAIGSIQTSFGTFVAFYLADLGWSKESVGLALATGHIAGVLAQIPGGAITDAIPWKRGFAAAGILMSMGAALILATAPLFTLVFVAQALDGLTVAIVTPAVAAISLGIVGRRAMSSRTGRNYRFAAAGIAITALAQGFIGSYVSHNAIFFATAVLCALALAALSFIRPDEIDYARARNASAADGGRFQSVAEVLRNRPLRAFVSSLMLYQFADASIVPLLSEEIGEAKTANSSLQISGLVVSMQLVVMLLAPWVGYLSEKYGRKPLLLLGFGVAALRSVLLAATTDYSFILVGQVLGGVTTAIVEVLVIVIITDLTARTGRFNLVGGAVTMLLGIASSLSVAASGFIFSAVGHAPTFMSFAVIAGLATLFAWSMLPETKPAQYED
jgi:MFS family permease